MSTIEPDAERISFHETGVGETVVLLHGAAGSRADWRSLMAALTPRFHVLAPELGGHDGRDDRPAAERPRLSLDTDLVASATAHSTEPVHLVGHSYGAAVALNLALRQPDRIRSLTLIEPAAFHLLKSEGRVERWLLNGISDVAAAVSAGSGDDASLEAPARFAALWHGRSVSGRDGRRSSAASSGQAERIMRSFRAAADEEVPLAAYHRIRVPTLILCGERTPWITLAIAELLAATMPSARLVIVDGLVHISAHAHPEAVSTAVAEHLCLNSGRPWQAA